MSQTLPLSTAYRHPGFVPSCWPGSRKTPPIPSSCPSVAVRKKQLRRVWAGLRAPTITSSAKVATSTAAAGRSSWSSSSGGSTARRVNCPRCGVKREQLEWLANNPRYTRRFVRAVGRRFRTSTLKDVAAEMELHSLTRRIKSQAGKPNLQQDNSWEWTGFSPFLSKLCDCIDGIEGVKCGNSPVFNFSRHILRGASCTNNCSVQPRSC